MLVVAGLSLRNLQPRIWEPPSQGGKYHIPGLKAVMVSYADMHAMAKRRKQAMEVGLHELLGVPKDVKVYLDNGAFFFRARKEEMPLKDYVEFVEHARPDWYPVPQDVIPLPSMELEEQQECLRLTMRMNRRYKAGNYVPVIHVSQVLGRYIQELEKIKDISAKPSIALGGIVPNLLRTPKAIPYADILAALRRVKNAFPGKEIHVFGMGGTATLHLATLLGFDSVDSSGWRNRAARGLIQLPGLGDREITKLGKWKGRQLDKQEREELERCGCAACTSSGLEGLKASGILGFNNRASHNLWVLHKEADWINEHMENGTYWDKFRDRLNNSTYLRLIEKVVAQLRPPGT